MNKTIICLTSCNRIKEVIKNINPYLLFCHKNKDFDFVISLDGNNKDYIDFCKKYKIPLIYSLEREGVGLSKNRVLKQFPDYDFYFFIDDDIELIDDSIFDLYISISREMSINYLSYNINGNIEMIGNGKYPLVGGKKGGGCFNFYTNKALISIGGWHILFAKYKRFGHTEHSYRVFYKKLNPFPFVAISNITEYLILNDPPHVTNLVLDHNENELVAEEQAMIDAKQTYFPLTTLSEFYFNGFDLSIPHLHPDLHKGRYALLKGLDKIKAWGNFYFHKFKTNKKPVDLILALMLYPNNNLLKHYIKTKLISWKENL